MATQAKALVDPTAAALAKWDDDHWGKVPLWLISSSELTHAQHRVLLVLLCRLGGRKGWWHMSYRSLCPLAQTDLGTLQRAMTKFIDNGWLLTKGPRNWRQYRLDKAKIADDLWREIDLSEEVD